MVLTVLKSQNWVEGEKNSDCCQWEKVECNKRLRWVGGLGRDLNLEEGQFQSPMEGGCPSWAFSEKGGNYRIHNQEYILVLQGKNSQLLV